MKIVFKLLEYICTHISLQYISLSCLHTWLRCDLKIFGGKIWNKNSLSGLFITHDMRHLSQPASFWNEIWLSPIFCHRLRHFPNAFAIFASHDKRNNQLPLLTLQPVFIFWAVFVEHMTFLPLLSSRSIRHTLLSSVSSARCGDIYCWRTGTCFTPHPYSRPSMPVSAWLTSSSFCTKNEWRQL